MRNRKIYVIITVLLVAALAVFLLTRENRRPMDPDRDTAVSTPETVSLEHQTVSPEPEAAETAAEAPAAATETQGPQEQPFLVQITDDDLSIAYVLVRMQNAIGLLPLPVEGEYTRTIRQTAADGSEAINVLHLTSEGVWMEDSNCEGHDCMLEGEVTLENREERVLWNMIICLPHQLSLELITREEAIQMIGR